MISTSGGYIFRLDCSGEMFIPNAIALKKIANIANNAISRRRIVTSSHMIIDGVKYIANELHYYEVKNFQLRLWLHLDIIVIQELH